MEYTELEIEVIDRVDNKYPVYIKSQWGEERSTLSYTAYQEILTDITGGNFLSIIFSSNETEKALKRIGEKLFNFLFVDRIYSIYRITKEQAPSGNTLRVKLKINSTELSVLPWEIIYEPADDFLAFNPSISIVRYIEHTYAINPPKITKPLYVLGIVCNPTSQTQLDTVSEKDSILAATKHLIDNGVIEIEWLDKCTFENLRRKLREKPWNILHFIGHGEYQENAEQGILFLEKEDGSADIISGSDFVRALRICDSLRFVMLNTCDSARQSAKDHFSSVAANLIKGRIPTVLAMQFPITDNAARIFSSVFYERLATGEVIDSALYEARCALSRLNTGEWSAPVLYSREVSGVLFDIQGKNKVGSQASEQYHILDLLFKKIEDSYSRETIEIIANLFSAEKQFLELGYKDVLEVLKTKAGSWLELAIAGEGDKYYTLSQVAIKAIATIAKSTGRGQDAVQFLEGLKTEFKNELDENQDGKHMLRAIDKYIASARKQR